MDVSNDSMYEINRTHTQTETQRQTETDRDRHRHTESSSLTIIQVIHVLSDNNTSYTCTVVYIITRVGLHSL